MNTDDIITRLRQGDPVRDDDFDERRVAAVRDRLASALPAEPRHRRVVTPRRLTSLVAAIMVLGTSAAIATGVPADVIEMMSPDRSEGISPDANPSQATTGCGSVDPIVDGELVASTSTSDGRAVELWVAETDSGVLFEVLRIAESDGQFLAASGQCRTDKIDDWTTSSQSFPDGRPEDTVTYIGGRTSLETAQVVLSNSSDVEVIVDVIDGYFIAVVEGEGQVQPFTSENTTVTPRL